MRVFGLCVLFLSWFVLWPTRADAQDDVTTDREVVVAFQPGVVARPGGITEGPPAAFDFGAPGLAVALDQIGVEHVYQLFPDFTPEDRFVTTEWGETLEITDWTDTYVLRLREAGARPGLLGLLNALRGEVVVYAEPNPTVDFFDRTQAGPVPTAAPETLAAVAVGGPLPCALPNGGGGGGEPYFCHQWALANTGQGMGTQGVDINAQGAWTRTTEASTVAIAVVDGGINDVHPEFLAADGVTSRVSGDPPSIGSFHGNGVTGVAAARGDNGVGIAGVAWDVAIVNERLVGDNDSHSETNTASAIASAVTRGADVINCSWGVRVTPTGPWQYSVHLRKALADAYRQGRTVVAAIGNGGGSERAWPAAYHHGVVAVGATTNRDERALYSTFGSWIDVAAPGGSWDEHPSQWQSEADEILTTEGYPNSYQDVWGTSFAAPHVSGLAALLISYRPDLDRRPDDVEGLLKASALDLTSGGGSTSNGTCTAGTGFDDCFGAKRIDADAALDLLDPPYTLTRGTASRGTATSVSGPYLLHVYGKKHVAINPGTLADGLYSVRRHTVERTVSIGPYQSVPHAWGRGAGPGLPQGVGWAEDDDGAGTRYAYAMPHTEVVAVTASTVTLRTHVYEVSDVLTGASYGYHPVAPHEAEFAYTVVGVPASPGGSARPGDVATAKGASQPWSVELAAYPNPVRGTAAVTFTLAAASDVRLGLYDVLGREVARLAAGLRAGEATLSRRVTLLH